MEPGVRVWMENDCFRVEFDASRSLVISTRSSRPFSSAGDAERACLQMLAAFDEIGRDGHRLLIDSRAATANNSPVYEGWFAPYRTAMPVGFARAAVVVRTAIGALQARRLADLVPNSIVVFTSMEEAITWLCAEDETVRAVPGVLPPRR